MQKMRRREFTMLVGGAAMWPLAVRAQPKRARRIGVLAPLPATVFAPFFSELRQLGFIEGQNLAVDRRGFNARYDQLSTIAADIMKVTSSRCLSVA
jgi:putative ABC transport system substrate-binding protein